MPGIFGISSRKPPEECQLVLAAMLEAMENQSFYQSATHVAPELGLYAGCVGEESSFSPGQIFFNEKRDIALVLSGECFIDRGMRSDLRRKGHKIDADNDWLVHLYEEEGDQFFEKLNGLFSGLLIDKRQRKGFLFNDRYGVERIYWHERDGDVYFASQAHALLKALPELREFDDDGVAQFLTYGCTVDWRTLFEGIQVLPGASVWSFEKGKCYKRKYFSPKTWEAQRVLSQDTFESEFQETFKRILPRYFESPTPIGISLTGGLDTRMIMACRPKTDENPVGYTFSGEKRVTVDGRLAARIAGLCGIEHRLLRIGPDFFSDFASHADRTVCVTDGSFGITGAHEIYFNGQARRLAPVRLTGNFGSEVLRGISTFKPIGLSHDLLDPEFSRFVNGSVKTPSPEHPVTFSAFQEIPWHLAGCVAAAKSQVIFRTPYLDNELVALAYRMPEHLRKSPQAASRLIAANSNMLSAIPTDRGFVGDNSGLAFLYRRFFAEAAFKIDYYNSEGLPHGLSRFDSFVRRVSSYLGILELHKYLPYPHWFRRELAPHVTDVLARARVQQMRFWDRGFLKRLAADHVSGRMNYTREIDAVLTLEAVERLLLRRPSRCEPLVTATIRPELIAVE